MPTLLDARTLAMAGRNEEAVQLIRQLAGAGNRDAIFMLAEMTWRGGLVPQDSYAARRLYEAAKGHARADIYATNLLASGIAGPRNWQEALRRLKKEAARDTARRRAFDLLKAMDLDEAGNPKSLPAATNLSVQPSVKVFPKLFSPDECRYLIDIAGPGYQPSMVFNDDEQLVQDPIRTSDGSAIHWLIEDPVVHAINRRIAAATGFRKSCRGR